MYDDFSAKKERFSLQKISDDVTMTSFLAKTANDIKILTKPLQNHIIREAFAKKRMSKALSVQKKIGHGPTHTHTHRSFY